MFTHLRKLEAESIHIMREVAATAENPVMLYSVGKDSSVMLHLAMKAFYPSKPPFPLMHVDTTWKFSEMITFRDQLTKDLGLDLIVHINQDGVRDGVGPFTHGSAVHTDIMKTVGLKQGLDKHGFDVAFGGARRDEEKSRAKERIFSFRTDQHRWDPKSQRPEIWNVYNTRIHKGESIRSSRSATGPEGISTSTSSRFRLCRCTSPLSVRWSSGMASSSWSTTTASRQRGRGADGRWFGSERWAATRSLEPSSLRRRRFLTSSKRCCSPRHLSAKAA